MWVGANNNTYIFIYYYVIYKLKKVRIFCYYPAYF